ncbi:hypothetical protein [Streptomyces sp. CAU 1734]|uniref:hypothetical protein n=1 Tax=Streptomyces sp. CAU 1734 TaxID=3140360 RepID=UPI003260F022
MDERGAISANRLEAWADGVLGRLDAQEEADRSLLHALPREPTLREETTARMADALRAAALGLGPAGCAVAARVSERLLLNWQRQDAAFAAAMAAAAELAPAGENGRPPLSPLALRVLLRAVRGGALHGSAAALIGMSGRAFYRLRRDSPEIAALVAAARRSRPKKSGRRGRPGHEEHWRYRLVRVDTSPPPAAPCPVPPADPAPGPVPPPPDRAASD